MAKTKRGFIFAAFLVSCGATVLAIFAMATENWISATLTPKMNGVKGNGLVNYGLFFGTFENNPIGSSYNSYRITCECVTSVNGCAFSSKEKKEDREKEINKIISGEDCSKNTKTLNEILTENLLEERYSVPDVSVEFFEENKTMYNRTKSAKLIDSNNQINVTDNVSQFNRIKRNSIYNYIYNRNDQQNDTIPECDPTFLNMGLYITTLMFLSIAILVGSLTSIISLQNVVGNPVNPWFNIWGLYIWNSTAAVIYFLVLIQWGVEYDLYAKINVGIIETLGGRYSNEEVGLGYSYWILLVSIFLHALSCGLFYLRQHLIDKEPEIPDKPDGNTDGMIFVY